MMSNARCSRRRLVVLGLATSLLSGCATVGSEPGIATVCPPVVEYSREFQARAAEELARLRPSEILVSEDQTSALGEGWAPTKTPLTARPGWEFDFDSAHLALTRHFGTHDLSGFGCAHLRQGVQAAGALLAYAQTTQRNRELALLNRVIAATTAANTVPHRFISRSFAC